MYETIPFHTAFHTHFRGVSGPGVLGVPGRVWGLGCLEPWPGWLGDWGMGGLRLGGSRAWVAERIGDFRGLMGLRGPGGLGAWREG